MAKKRLLITTDCFLPRWDGVARFLSEIIPALKKDFDITVIAPLFSGKMQKMPGIRLIRLPLLKIKFGDIYFARWPAKRVDEEVKKTDLVFNQTIGTIGTCAIKSAKKHNKPIISFIHSIEWELASQGVKRFKKIAYYVTRYFARKLYSQCDLLIVPSTNVEDVLLENKITGKKAVVHLGINPLKFKPAASKQQAKKALGIPENCKVIGFVGRLGREKNLITLYQAFKKLQKIYFNLKLLIVGSGIEEGIFMNNKQTILAGSQTDVVPYLQAMDIYVLPSLTETSSLSTMEAMSTGLPVVVTPVGSIREYVEDGVNGFVFPRKDSGKLMQKLEILLTNDGLGNTMGMLARKKIIEKYNFADSAEKIRKILEEF